MAYHSSPTASQQQLRARLPRPAPPAPPCSLLASLYDCNLSTGPAMRKRQLLYAGLLGCALFFYSRGGSSRLRMEDPEDPLERLFCTSDLTKSWCITVVTPAAIAKNIARLDALCPVPRQTPNASLPNASLIQTPVGTLLNWREPIIEAARVATAAGRPGFLMVARGHAQNPKLDLRRYYSRIKLGHTHIGGYNETMALFRALIRCRQHFSVVRYGDGEIALMRQQRYTGEESLIEGNDGLQHTQWEFSPESEGAGRLVDLLYSGFQLAAEQAAMVTMNTDVPVNPLFLGVPLYFCREGMTSTEEKKQLYGGGGRYSWLEAFLTYKGNTLTELPTPRPGIGRRADLLKVLQQRIVYSWQWGNLNYGATVDMLHQMQDAGTRIILICSEAVTEQEGGVPRWASAIITVPSAGLDDFQNFASPFETAAKELASSVRDHVFVISAGPIAKAIIPLMNVANPLNTYLDIGGSLDPQILGRRTRAFQPKRGHEGLKPWVKAGGALQQGQRCTETRWNIHSLNEERAGIDYVVAKASGLKRNGTQ